MRESHGSWNEADGRGWRGDDGKTGGTGRGECSTIHFLDWLYLAPVLRRETLAGERAQANQSSPGERVGLHVRC